MHFSPPTTAFLPVPPEISNFIFFLIKLILNIGSISYKFLCSPKSWCPIKEPNIRELKNGTRVLNIILL